MKKQIETQHLAVVGFRSWLESSQPAQPEDEDSREFKDQLLHVLQVYEWELERQIEGTLANQDWYSLIALTSITLVLLKDGSLESNPALVNYNPSNEPSTVDEMTLHLLCDAVATFETAQAEMAVYLVRPEFPDVVNGFIQTVLNAQ